jgi:hypothetical protein
MGANHPTRKTGALKAAPELLAKAVRFHDFQKAPLPLDTTPSSIDNVTGAPLNMGGNDSKGDCTIAGTANLFAIWCHALGLSITIIAAKVIAFYLALTGGVDSGLDPVVVMNKITTDGIDVGDGVTRKFAVWALIPIDNLPLIRFLIWKLKAVCLAGDLSDNDVGASSWTLPTNPGAGDAPDPENGHFFLAGAFGPLDADGQDCDMIFPTWGMGMPGRYSWFKSRGLFAAVALDAEAAEAIGFDFEGAVAFINNAPSV